jgi:DNA-binding beta-propeller fold protein YncE
MAAVLASAAALSFWGSGAGAAAAHARAAALPATAAPGRAFHAAAPGAQLWVARYNGPKNSWNRATEVAVSPDGSTVFVTGSSGPSYATVAYNAATGAQLWVQRYGANSSQPAALAVSPDGSTVFVTGTSYTGTATGYDYATVAYNAATGAQLWAARYDGPNHNSDAARSVAVSPDGRTVFVTGASYVDEYNFSQYATVAYDAATGAQLWVTRAGSGDGAVSVAVNPRNGTVYVTGSLFFFKDPWDRYDTIAYNAATGALLWEAAYGGTSGITDDPTSMTVGPYGTVYVTGSTTTRKGSQSANYLTLVYNASGTLVWAAHYNGPAHGADTAAAVAVTPNGQTVYVTGSSQGNGTGADYATIAYDTHTGAQLWVQRYNGPGNGTDAATSMAVSRDGTKVYVTGESLGPSGSYDYATVAYDAATGAQLWVQRYNGPGNSDDVPAALAVSPTANKLFVTGYSYGTTSYTDYATIAYGG